MRYSILASTEYYKGRVVFCSGKLSYNSVLLRRLFEWSSSLDVSDEVRILVVDGSGGSPSLFEIGSPDRCLVEGGDLRNLTNLSFLSSYSCIFVQGVSNDFVSPVIRGNVELFVQNGGGLLVSEPKVAENYISIFENIGPIYCESKDFILTSGKYLWTTLGKLNYVFSNEFLGLSILPTSTILETGLSSCWGSLFVFDSSVTVDQNSIEIVGSVFSSADYEIPGANFSAYMSSVYKNGILKVD